MRVSVVAVAMTAGACYAPTPPAGAPCTSSGGCPDGLRCLPTPDGNRCVVEGPFDAPADTASGDGPPSDTPPDGAACTPRRLLAGGTNPTSQGWEVLHTGSSTISANGTTTLLTTAGGTSTQLLVLRDQVPATSFAIDVKVQVASSGGHEAGNAAAAIMASFHEPLGDTADRTRMVYLDNASIGWGDNTLDIGLTTTQVHTYRLQVANGQIRLIVDGGSISVGGGAFATNRTIAIGDQTADSPLDSTILLTSVDLVCL